MKKLIIERRLDAPPEKTLQSVRQMARSFGGSVAGDLTGGTFSGKGISGSYRIHDGNIIITVEEKPFLLPWTVIKEKINEFLAELAA